MNIILKKVHALSMIPKMTERRSDKLKRGPKPYKLLEENTPFSLC